MTLAPELISVGKESSLSSGGSVGKCGEPTCRLNPELVSSDTNGFPESHAEEFAVFSKPRVLRERTGFGPIPGGHALLHSRAARTLSLALSGG